jgi:hypothetical protein
LNRGTIIKKKLNVNKRKTNKPIKKITFSTNNSKTISNISKELFP